ncbi:MAG: hypothetical protein K9N23_13065 [Akkermansiaceae bacterium]|nr:hypothetical protein [Akkermansiaceae bacterium]
MNWSDIPLNPGRKVLRQFAALWIVFFVALGVNQFLAHGRPGLGLALMAAGLIVGIPGVLRPSLLRRIFVAWMVLAFPIGWLVSTLMLLGLYFLVFTPLALFFRLRGRDWLRRKPAPEQDTFWEPKENPLDPLSYFRQH